MLSVPKTLVDIDFALLARAQHYLGTKTKKQTIEAALREIVRRKVAEEYIEYVRTHDPHAELRDPEFRRRAWR
jgi:Arc/MetJ family transcription regulator